MKNRELFSRYMSHIENQGIKVECVGFPEVRFSGDDEFLVWKARNTVTDSSTLFIDLAEHLGIKDELIKDMGTDFLRGSHLRHVYGSIVCPLDQFEEDMSYYWRERQGICFADGLPDSFILVWYLNMEADKCESYWNPYYSIDPKYVRSAARGNSFGEDIFMDIRGGWHVKYIGGVSERDMFNMWKQNYEYYDVHGIGWEHSAERIAPADTWEVLTDQSDDDNDILNGVSGMSKQ